MDKIKILKSSSVFSKIEDKLLKQVISQLKETTLKKGEEIFKEGAKADAFYVVDSGEVAIYKQLGPGKEKTLAVLPSGSVFGEMAFFSDSPRTANAKTNSETTLLKIGRKDFLKFINNQPKAGLQITSELLQISMDRLEQTSRELATIYQTGKVISSGQNLKDIIKGIMDETLLAIPQATNCCTYIYNEFNQEYYPIGNAQDLKEIPEISPVLHTVKEIESGQIIKDTSNFKEISVLKDSKSLLTSPITKDSKLSGFIILWSNKKSTAFKNSHCLLISSVCGQLAEAIENIKFQQEARDRARLNQAKNTY